MLKLFGFAQPSLGLVLVGATCVLGLTVAGCLGKSSEPTATIVPASDDQAANEWMRFRGPNGSGVFQSERPLPTQLDIAAATWSADVPAGHSSPIVVGDQVVLTGFESHQLLTLAFDLATGEPRWRQAIDVADLEKYHQQHGPATPTPASDGERIFVYFGSFGLVCYDLAGNELWRHEQPIRQNLFGSASSPVVIDQRLIIFAGDQQQSLLQALDPRDGTVLWQRQRPGPASSWSSPVRLQLPSATAVVFYEPFHLRAVSLTDGTDLWAVPGLADEPITIPLIDAQRVFTTSYNLRTNREAIGIPSFETLLQECDSDGDGKISRTEANTNRSILSRPDADGQGDHPLRMFVRMLDENQDQLIDADEWPGIHRWMESWNHANGLVAIDLDPQLQQPPSRAWVHADGVPECPSPLLIDGRIYSVRNGGVVTCVDADSGQTLFFERLAGPGPYYASPVAAGNQIFLISARGTVNTISASVPPQLLGTSDLGQPVWATPAMVEGGLIIRGTETLWRFDGDSP